MQITEWFSYQLLIKVVCTYPITFDTALTAFGGALTSLTLSCDRKTMLTYPMFSFGDGTGSEYDAPMLCNLMI